MKRFITSLFFVFCFTLMVSAQHIRDSITVGADSREFLLHLPNGFAPSSPVPLVLAFHGMGDNVNSFRSAVGLSGVADTANFIVVYPQGLMMNMIIQNVTAWRIGTPFDGAINDVAFASDLIDTIKARYLIDTTRIFATGHSMGGFLAHRLACELNNKIAAIASNAGPLAEGTETTCSSDHVIPVLHLHGTADATVGYDAGGPFAPFFAFNRADSTTAFWAALNECNVVPDSTRLPDIKNDGLTVDRFDYADCSDSSEVILYRVNGGTHTWWFSSNHDISSTQIIWNFFSRHKMGEARIQDTTGTGLNSFVLKTSVNIYPNPNNGRFVVETSLPVSATIEVYDALGQLVKREWLNGNQTQMDISQYNPGMYFLRVTDAANNKTLAQQRIIVQ